MYSNFRVGVGVFVFNPAGQVILGKRIGGYDAGAWALPGGHLDLGESFEDCAVHELLEETGIIVNPQNVRFLTVTNDFVDEDGKHYITIFMGCSLPLPAEESGRRLEAEFGIEPQNLEPDKCAGWEWVRWKDLAAWGEQDCSMSHFSDAVNENAEEVKRGKFDRRRLSVPLLNLLEQRPGLDPLLSYHETGTRHRK